MPRPDVNGAECSPACQSPSGCQGKRNDPPGTTSVLPGAQLAVAILRRALHTCEGQREQGTGPPQISGCPLGGRTSPTNTGRSSPCVWKRAPLHLWGGWASCHHGHACLAQTLAKGSHPHVHGDLDAAGDRMDVALGSGKWWPGALRQIAWSQLSWLVLSGFLPLTCSWLETPVPPAGVAQ